MYLLACHDYVLYVQAPYHRHSPRPHTTPDSTRSRSPAQVELPKLVAALKRAAADERCRGVVTYVGPREHLGGLATVQVGRRGQEGWEVPVRRLRGRQPL